MAKSLQGLTDDGLGRGPSEPIVVPYGDGGYAITTTDAFGNTKILTSCLYTNPLGADIDLEMIRNGMMTPYRFR